VPATPLLYFADTPRAMLLTAMLLRRYYAMPPAAIIDASH